MGDFNCVMSKYSERQPNTNTPLSRMSKMLKYQSSEFPNGRDFRFYSHRHTFYCRIDYFFTPKKDLHRIPMTILRPLTYRIDIRYRTKTNFQTMATKCLTP